MRSLYKIVRASQITLENTRYQLSTDITFKHNRIQEPEKDESGVLMAEFTEDGDGAQSPSVIEQANEEASRIMLEAQTYADELLATAKLDADTIIAQAYDQAQKISEQALQEGHEAGYQKGLLEAQAQTENMILQALEIKTDIAEKRKALYKSTESEIVAMVMSIAEKILQKRIDEDENLIYDLVKVGIEKCLYSGVITLRVAEEDFDYALGFKNAILVLTENVEDILIKRDKALKKGSCILDTQSGSVDSGVWVQFEQIKKHFDALLSERITEYDTESV